MKRKAPYQLLLKLFFVLPLCMIFTISFGWANNTSHLSTKKSKSNIKYIDISIQQSGVDECLGMTIPQQGYNADWIEVYPNPNSGQFALELQLQDAGTTLLIKMYDLAGKQVYESSEVPNGKHFRKDLDVNHLKKGVYFLHITGKDKVGVKHIIIN